MIWIKKLFDGPKLEVRASAFSWTIEHRMIHLALSPSLFHSGESKRKVTKFKTVYVIKMTTRKDAFVQSHAAGLKVILVHRINEPRKKKEVSRDAAEQRLLCDALLHLRGYYKNP